ncbi:MAG: aminoacyl-histidine dipeptidase [Deltaproteobacteria bacterium]|nr:aminoacyl-histidine dipeptidase [Deltaproteobacteria bacterium]
MQIEHAKTKTILDWFEALSKIPRCSKNEEAIRKWLLAWSSEHGFEARTDEVGNVVIEVPASAGLEKAPAAVIQGHMDMVCEKTKGSAHDFSRDPIKMVYTDDGWLTADGTTLGADNGIAIAMALALALDEDAAHPPLELLFTVDEETGLTGASALKPGFIKGSLLMNVDSEDEGVFTVGCAGGKDTQLALPVELADLPAGHKALKLVAGGMSGGHSGVDIHEQRANALKMLARALLGLVDLDLRLVSLEGGTAHNAIPRDAEALIALPASAEGDARKRISALDAALKKEFDKTDPKIAIELQDGESQARAMPAAMTRKAIDFILAIPHGVAAMSKDIPGLVETSDNLATAKIEAGQLKVMTSQRSSNMDRLELLTKRIEGIARLAGGEAVSGGGYPAWQPDMSSKLLARCKSVYTELFGKQPVVEVIHAGLECGIIGSKYPGMDMISFGPTIKNPHSPDEKIDIKTIGQVWDFMVALLGSLK